jgi:hypothetical protein
MVVTRGVPNLKLWGGNEASFLLALHSRQKGNPSAFPTTIYTIIWLRIMDSKKNKLNYALEN